MSRQHPKYGASVRLRTFGRARIVDNDGEDVAVKPLAVALLAYLAVHVRTCNKSFFAKVWPRKTTNPLLTDSAVDSFAYQIGMPKVLCVFANEMNEHLTNR